MVLGRAGPVTASRSRDPLLLRLGLWPESPFALVPSSGARCCLCVVAEAAAGFGFAPRRRGGLVLSVLAAATGDRLSAGCLSSAGRPSSAGCLSTISFARAGSALSAPSGAGAESEVDGARLLPRGRPRDGGLLSDGGPSRPAWDSGGAASVAGASSGAEFSCAFVTFGSAGFLAGALRRRGLAGTSFLSSALSVMTTQTFACECSQEGPPLESW